jgi:hypothetical protein
MRESNTSNTVQSIEQNIDMTFEEAQVSILSYDETNQFCDTYLVV